MSKLPPSVAHAKNFYCSACFQHKLIVYPMHWIDPVISFSISVFVNRSIVERLRPQFFTDFARGSETWSLRRLLSVRQTGSSFPILVVCGFRFRQLHFSTDEHQIPYTDKIQQCRLCIQW